MAPAHRLGRGGLLLREYRGSDRDAVYDICVLTGADGGDARGLYGSDALLPDVYAGPYLAYAPDLVSIVSDGKNPVGYLLAVADTADFVRWYRRHWLPGFRARHAERGATAPGEREVIAAGLNPERMLVAELAEYPAHLHIDLLPAAQGRGIGRALITDLRARLQQRGVPGLHLSHSPANQAAGAFYARLGFRNLPSSTPDRPLLGIGSAEPPAPSSTPDRPLLGIGSAEPPAPSSTPDRPLLGIGSAEPPRPSHPD